MSDRERRNECLFVCESLCVCVCVCVCKLNREKKSSKDLLRRVACVTDVAFMRSSRAWTTHPSVDPPAPPGTPLPIAYPYNMMPTFPSEREGKKESLKIGLGLVLIFFAPSSKLTPPPLQQQGIWPVQSGDVLCSALSLSTIVVKHNLKRSFFLGLVSSPVNRRTSSFILE